jgi:hypothetical protein
MRNRDENNMPNSGKIRTIKQRFYQAIDRFGEVHKSKLYIPDNWFQESKNFDLEYDVIGNIVSKCVHFPYIDKKMPSNPEISDNTPLVRIQFKYHTNRVIELEANTSGIVEETPNKKYLRYFDLKEFFSIPDDNYTEHKDDYVDIENSPVVRFEYDSIGLKIKESNLTLNRQVIEITEFNYTEEDKIKDVTTIDEEGTVIRKIIYKYAENGLLTEIKDYGVEGMIRNRTEFIYHDKSSVPKIITIFDEKGEINDQYKFGEEGKLSLHEKNERNWNDSTHKTTYTYDYHSNGKYDICENGTFMHKKYYDANDNLSADWSHQSYNVYNYNKKNLKIERIDFKAHNDYYTDTVIDRIIYKYKYDANENWIECVSYRNELPFEIMTREISYF